VTGVFVGNLGYALGEVKHGVAESAAEGRLLSSAADLHDAGFRWHHRCGRGTTAYDLARAALRRLAGPGGLDGVDAIVYATSLPCNATVGDQADWLRTRDVKYLMDFPAGRLQADFGLTGSVVFGLDQQACTGMLGSVRLAHALLGAEPGWRRVLCVTADRFPEGALYEQAYNVISDGAAACTVDRGTGPFRFVAAHQITNGGLGRADDDETVGAYFGYTHKSVLETLAKAGMVPADLTWIVTQNTIAQAWLVLSRMLGIDADRVWAPSMPDTGHVISADNIINLLELQHSGKLRPGDRILLTMAGFGMNWQCLVLEATGGATR
jgi:3-oxoacyl-[acyl-carrier-protein] synthase-3